MHRVLHNSRATPRTLRIPKAPLQSSRRVSPTRHRTRRPQLRLIRAPLGTTNLPRPLSTTAAASQWTAMLAVVHHTRAMSPPLVLRDHMLHRLTALTNHPQHRARTQTHLHQGGTWATARIRPLHPRTPRQAPPAQHHPPPPTHHSRAMAPSSTATAATRASSTAAMLECATSQTNDLCVLLCLWQFFELPMR